MQNERPKGRVAAEELTVGAFAKLCRESEAMFFRLHIPEGFQFCEST